LGSLNAIISPKYHAGKKTGHYNFVAINHQGLTVPTGGNRSVIVKSLQKY
jgi:hypothetical protein